MKKGAKSRAASIGIDVGGTKTLLGLFDSRFDIVAEEKWRTHEDKGPRAAFERRLKKSLKVLFKEAAERGLKVKAIGVGVAGLADMKRGRVRIAANLRFLDRFDFREMLGTLTRAPVFVCNDVHAGLFGEFRLGNARGTRHAIGVFVGTGVGGAMIIDGKLHVGAGGVAGDIGNYLIHPGPSERPEHKEVLDSVASRTAIAGEAAALAAKRRAPMLSEVAGTDVKEIKSGDIAEAIARGDEAVEKLVRSRAGMLGSALSNLVDFINPEVIVLGGGLVEAMPRLVKTEVDKAIRAHCSKRALRDVKVVVAKLLNHAGTTGAACLAVEMFSKKPPLEL
jgi:glucokinase